MDESKASVAIFQKSIDQEEHESCPNVPKDVFDAAIRVSENKGSELVKSRDGLYFVQYSEHGPFSEHIGEKWLPVYIARALKWTSGGIRQTELDEYLNG